MKREIALRMFDMVSDAKKINDKASRSCYNLMEVIKDLHNKWFQESGFYEYFVGKYITLKVDRLYASRFCDESKDDYIFDREVNIEAKITSIGFNEAAIYDHRLCFHGFRDWPEIFIVLDVENVKILEPHGSEMYIKNRTVRNDIGRIVNYSEIPWYVQLLDLNWSLK